MPDRFIVTKRGYDIEAVDAYIETLEKIIDSYKEKDSAIKNAIINAQIAADNIVLNAKKQADVIKAETKDQAREIVKVVNDQRLFLKNFRSDYTAMARKYLHTINQSDFAEIETSIDDFVDSLNRYLDGPIPPSSENPGVAGPVPSPAPEPKYTAADADRAASEAQEVKNALAPENNSAN